jgi:hypothetical protein
MMRDPYEICGYCRFYHQWESALWTRAMTGNCRKTAPTPADGFATIRYDDWCGDFSSKRPPTTSTEGGR